MQVSYNCYIARTSSLSVGLVSGFTLLSNEKECARSDRGLNKAHRRRSGYSQAELQVDHDTCRYMQGYTVIVVFIVVVIHPDLQYLYFIMIDSSSFPEDLGKSHLNGTCKRAYTDASKYLERKDYLDILYIGRISVTQRISNACIIMDYAGNST